MAYVIMFVAAVVGSLVFVPNVELVLIALAGLGAITSVELLGRTFDFSLYVGAHPALLGLTAAVGTMIGASAWYLATGKGLELSPRLKSRVQNFDFVRFRASTDIILVVSSLTSLPPVKLTTVAAAVIGYPFWRYLAISFPAKIARFLGLVYLLEGILRLERIVWRRLEFAGDGARLTILICAGFALAAAGWGIWSRIREQRRSPDSQSRP